MNELRSRVPADCPVDVKGVKTLNTSDGYAMTATLYWKGKRIAHVENHGTGGPNDYRPWAVDFGDVAGSYARFRETLAEVQAYANEWCGERDDSTGMNLDLLVEELMNDKDLARETRKVAKGGSRFVALAHKGPYWWGDDVAGEPDGYEETYVVGTDSREAFMRDAERRGYDAFRVLAE